MGLHAPKRPLRVARKRFRSGEFWRMHAMVWLWLLFTVILFVAEPLVLHRWFHRRAIAAPEPAFPCCIALTGFCSR
jgi:hypothetical protein